MGTSARHVSKLEWNFDGASAETINCGSLQRIADACELMAKNHQALINERDQYKRWYETEKANHTSVARSNTSLKGTVTRLQRKIASLEAQR